MRSATGLLVVQIALLLELCLALILQLLIGGTRRGHSGLPILVTRQVLDTLEAHQSVSI